MNKQDCYSIGYVARTSGVKGEVMLELDVDEPARYRSIDAVFLDVNGSLVPFFVKTGRVNGKQLTLALEGIDDPPAAKMLVGCEAWLPLAALPPLDEKRFYFHEIKGFEVIDERYGPVGIAQEVLDRMMQPVLVVLNGKAEVLLPLSKGAIEKVDREKKQLLLRSPEGLIELYLQPQSDTPDDSPELGVGSSED